MSLRDELKAWGNPQPEEVDVPGHGRLYVRKLTVGQAQKLGAQAAKYAKNDEHIGYAWLFCQYACDADGAAIYDPSKREDVEEVAAFELSPVKWFVERAQELHGIGGGEKKAP